MSPEEKARQIIDDKLIKSGWVIQDMKDINLSASIGVAVREFPTSTGEADYALFIDGTPVGVIEAKRSEMGENITTIEKQTSRYANSKLKYLRGNYRIRFVYEATDNIVRFTDYDDIKYRSREIFSFHRPQTLQMLLREKDTIRNNLKHFPKLDTTGFRDCQIRAINNLEESFALNKPKALVQMATGAGKTFTAITASYRLLKYGRMNRILFLVDTKSLGVQAETEFKSYRPNDDNRQFSEIYGVHRLKSSRMPTDVQIYISTIQRMYSMLKGEELDEKLEENPYEYEKMTNKQPKEVVYNEKYPPEFFDCIIVDECHRSIYNVWKQVLEYFDAFLVGLTATPDKRTFAFFNQNVVSEYSREQAIVDNVNVGEDVFLIETNITKNGAHIMKQMIEYRSRETRAKRWKEMDEDMEYISTQLDKDIVNPDQIRTVIRTFKERLFTQLFPDRKIVPKTLIFAKTDSHADDIIQIVREEFGEGNDFCQKITYSANDPEKTLNSFRNDYYPRIAVTVDMIATGTDVKAIECLVFMRDVRSKSYFEQMKGRGTRVLNKDDLQRVTPDVKENKSRFIIVDAVGVTTSKKSDTRPLERKPSVSLNELMKFVSCGSKDEDTLTSLANRIIRLNAQMSNSERREFTEKAGMTPSKAADNLLNAFDPNEIAVRAGVAVPDDISEMSKEEKQKYDKAQEEMIKQAVQPFYRPEVREFIEGVRRSHEQLIDSVNADEVLFAGFATQKKVDAETLIGSFHDFIEENKDEITALGIVYDRKYKDRPMVIRQLKVLYEKMKQKSLTVERLWDAYAFRNMPNVRKGTVAQLTDLVCMIRFEMGLSDKLEPFSDKVNYNFMQWTLRRNAGPVHFTEEQMEWLRLIKDHISSSLSIQPEDLDLSPFDRKGGLGRFYDVFGDEYESILQEMNLELVA